MAAAVVGTSVALAAVMAATVVAAAEFSAGGYTFSDELGGFRLLSASGSGTPADPVVITEEIAGIDEVVLVIRRQAGVFVQGPANRLTLVKRVANRSKRVWAGFEVELREIRDRPSPRQDGLSFNQLWSEPGDVDSDAFPYNDRRFEPTDRIVFEGGSVDPDGTVSLRLTITDPTPVPVFYLLQDPNILLAGISGPGTIRASLLSDEAADGGGGPLTPPAAR